MENTLQQVKVKYEYGAMSSKFEVTASNKLTAYACMILHYDRSNHLVVIYSPESSRADMWTSLVGKVAERLDEIYGGEASFDKYLGDNVDEIRESFETIKRLI